MCRNYISPEIVRRTISGSVFNSFHFATYHIQQNNGKRGFFVGNMATKNIDIFVDLL